ncbi:MAG TPA: NnrU family protein [Solimonas sp.]|nr:NnrU family protein [Solimonas sp.]
MTTLALAAAAFAAMHLLIAGTRVRDALVARLGEKTYLGAFSLASAAVLGWLIWAYAGARQPALTPLLELRWLAAVLVFVAFTLIVLGLATPGPTVVGGEKLLTREDPARGIHRITRHPFLWGVALWALVHLAFNPERANLVFFGTFALVAIVGTFSIDAKRERRFEDAWRRYARLTSNLPFVAIAQGRNRLVLAELGWGKLAAAVAAYAAFVALHGRFFGLPPI